MFEVKARQFHSSIEQIAFIPPPCRMPERSAAIRLRLQPVRTQYRNSDCVYSDVWMVTDGSTELRLLARNLKAITAATTHGIA